MSDNYKKQKPNKTESYAEVLKLWRDQKDNEGRRSSSASQSKQKLCCNYFKIKTGFVLFGICDIVIFLFCATAAIKDTINENQKPDYFWIVMLQVIPKIIGFTLVLVADSLSTRHIYKVMLRIIMILMMFVLPIYCLVQVKSQIIPKDCKSQLEDFLNPDQAQPRYSGTILDQTTNVKNEAGHYTEVVFDSSLNFNFTTRIPERFNETLDGLANPISPLSTTPFINLKYDKCASMAYFFAIGIYSCTQLLYGYQQSIAEQHYENRRMKEETTGKKDIKMVKSQLDEMQKLLDKYLKVKVDNDSKENQQESYAINS